MNWDESHPDYKEELGRRIQEVIPRFASKSEAARAAGVSVEQLNKWTGLKGGDIPKVPVQALLALASAANVDFCWLATGKERFALQTQDMNGDCGNVQIPRYDVQASAGGGRLVDDERLLGTIPFRPEFFTKNLQRNPRDMAIIDAVGDSMAPTMNDRDLVMIDTSTASEPVTAGIYAFSFDDAVFVKRLQRQPNGLLVTSDNKHYREFRISFDDLNRVRLHGRVVWIGRML